MVKLQWKAANSLAAFFLSALALTLPAGPASAAARLAANPVQLRLPAQALATSLTLRNRGAEAVTVQSEIFDWQQFEGQDRLTPTRELLVSPPIFSIPPGESQVVRIGRLRAGAPGAQERAFRIELSEVPSAVASPNHGVATLLKLSIPIFVPAASPDRPRLIWDSQHLAGDGLQLRVNNPTNSHIKLSRLELAQDSRAIASRDLSFYVLPGSTRELGWPGVLRSAQPGLPLQILSVLGNRVRLNQPLPLGAVSVVPQP